MSSSTRTSLLPNFTVEPGCTGTARTPPGTAVGSAEACAQWGAKGARAAAITMTRVRSGAFGEFCAVILVLVVMSVVTPLVPGSIYLWGVCEFL